METILYTALVVVLLPYLLNPILLRIKLRDYYEPCLEVVTEETLSQEVKSYLDSTAENFKQAGFYHCGYARMKNLAGTGEIFISLWFHRLEGISAYPSIAYMRLMNQPAKVFAKSICFVTRFSETSQFETSTSGVPTPLAMLPLRPCVQLPKSMEFQDLFAAHQALAKKFHPSSERLWVDEGQELATMKRKITEINQYQIQVGRWVLDTTPNVYHATWKCAFINGWQFAWPVSSVRKWLLKSRAEKLQASLKN